MEDVVSSLSSYFSAIADASIGAQIGWLACTVIAGTFMGKIVENLFHGRKGSALASGIGFIAATAGQITVYQDLIAV